MKFQVRKILKTRFRAVDEEVQKSNRKEKSPKEVAKAKKNKNIQKKSRKNNRRK